jgi:hypothetical protein
MSEAWLTNHVSDISFKRRKPFIIANPIYNTVFKKIFSQRYSGIEIFYTFASLKFRL